ncbi:MAG: ATP-dependent helicase [Pseudomonadota bacterium]
MMNLSKAQKAIVKAPVTQAIQVLASAGTGKTRVLTERVRYILNNTKKDGVIALTFTNKAAEEMQNRLSDSDAAEERAWIATIHAVAQRILEQYGHTIGLPSELHIYERDKDRMEVFMQSLRDDGVDIDDYLSVEDTKEQRNRERNLQRYMDGFSLIKRELLTEEDVTQRYPDSPTLWKIYQDYQNALLNSGGIDYDDILVYAHRLLLTQDWIANIYRAKYKHICVDEAQDLNKVQYEFIKALCGDVIKSIMMVGDPNQMIYGFNGSSADYLCQQFVQDFCPKRYELKENYRSTKEVIRVANKLKPDSQREHEFALKGMVEITGLSDEGAEAKWVIEKINSLIKLKKYDDIEGDISPNHMVVIARNRFIFSRLEQALTEHNILYSLRKGERRAEPTSLFGKVLDYAIRVKLNPKDWVDGKKLCALLGITPPTAWDDPDVLKKWSEQAAVSKVVFPDLQAKLLAAVHSLDVSDPNIRQFTRNFKRELDARADLLTPESTEYESGMLESNELERSIKELEEFENSWTRFKQKGLGDSLQAFRNALALGQLWENTVLDGLTLSTVHTMKGLEKDIVFLMGMCEGVFPDYRASSANEISEERNNAFVAVTRAKRWLYITYPKQRMMPWGDIKFQRQSRFITEIQA